MLIIVWQFAFKISNAAITTFLRLLKHLLLYFGRIFQSHELQQVANAVPLTLNTVHHLISLQKDDFHLYTVCPSCDYL